MIDRSEPLTKVLVIVPTYNEAQNIEPIISRIRAAVPDVDVLVADDNSPDGTGDIAERMASIDSHIQVLHRPGKQGLGVAYVQSFKWGLDHGYDVLIEHDADGSHQPEYLPAILAALANADMVKGSRWMRGGKVLEYSKQRELLSRAANIWVQMAMDIPVHDATGGLNAFRASALRAIDLNSIQSKGYTFQVDLTRRVLDAGGTVTEVPIEFPDRKLGQSKMSGSVITEALMRTAGWGAQKRWSQLRGCLTRATESAKPLTDKVNDKLVTQTGVDHRELIAKVSQRVHEMLGNAQADPKVDGATPPKDYADTRGGLFRGGPSNSHADEPDQSGPAEGPRRATGASAENNPEPPKRSL